MSRKRRRSPLKQDGPLAVANETFDGAAEASPELVVGWKGEAERYAAPKLLPASEGEAAPARTSKGSAVRAGGAGTTGAALPRDVEAIQQSVATLATKLETLLVRSHEALGTVVSEAVAAAGDRNGLVDASELRAVQARLEATEQRLQATTAELEDTRAQLAETRLTLEETAVQHAQARADLEAEQDASVDRAISMLAMLESLDAVIASLRRASHPAALAQIEHLEREATEMARLVEIEEIDARGCVDPDLHEIVSTVGGRARTGTIVEVRQRGYTFRGRLLRRSQVVVSARS